MRRQGTRQTLAKSHDRSLDRGKHLPAVARHTGQCLVPAHVEDDPIAWFLRNAHHLTANASRQTNGAAGIHAPEEIQFLVE